VSRHHERVALQVTSRVARRPAPYTESPGTKACPSQPATDSMSESESISCCLSLLINTAAMFSRINPELGPLGHDFRDTDRPSSASTVQHSKTISTSIGDDGVMYCSSAIAVASLARNR
jgi:hypothetical protein